MSEMIDGIASFCRWLDSSVRLDVMSYTQYAHLHNKIILKPSIL